MKKGAKIGAVIGGAIGLTLVGVDALNPSHEDTSSTSLIGTSFNSGIVVAGGMVAGGFVGEMVENTIDAIKAGKAAKEAAKVTE